MKTIALLGALLLLAGCARFGTTQYDKRTVTYDPKTHEKIGETTEVGTHAAGYTLFSGSSKLASWSASQTEKTQGAKVGSLEQAGGVDSNIVNAAVSAAVGAAVRAVKPTP